MKAKILLICMMLTILTIFCIDSIIINAEDSNSGISELNVSLINQNPDPARAGETVELKFMVENVGGLDAKNIEFELLPQYPFIAIPGEEYKKTIGTLKAYQQGVDAVIINFNVMVDKDAVRGANEIKLKRGQTGTGISLIETYDVDVTGTKFAQIIYVDKALLQPGNETPLKFTITNVGKSPLKDLVFSWDEETGVILPVYSDNTKYVDYIDVGKSAELEYIVVADVNANPGLYELGLTLKFESEDGISEEMITKAGIFIGGGTDFDVTFSESSGGQTSLSVANIGNNPALSVTVRIPEQQNFRVSGSTSSIIGNLDKGDYTIVSFQIAQAVTPANEFQGLRGTGQRFMNISRGNLTTQDNNLLVLIEYTDTTGARHTLLKSVPIQFRSSDTTTASAGTFRQGQNSWTLIYQIIMLLSAAVVAIVCYKKREFIRARLGKILKKKKG